MDETMAARFWCHMCSQMVNPIMELEIKCPLCQSGFVEEMDGTTVREGHDSDSDLSPDRVLSLWAPILLGMMNDPRRRRRFHGASDGDHDENENNEARHGGESDLDQELEAVLRRRRRSPAAILQLLRNIRSGIGSESENLENDWDRDRDWDSDSRGRGRERVILVNPFNQTLIVQGTYDLNQTRDRGPIGSLGDYFVGPGLDLLLQHLAENDPNRYGTPPAQKEAVEALPTVKIEETLQCSVCLDDFEVGAEAKEMPCKHRFHTDCLLPWLELHSSCPMCRHQLPADETKLDAERSRNRSSGETRGNDDNNDSVSNDADASSDDNNDNDRDARGDEGVRRFSLPWPFNGLFSSSSSHSDSSHSRRDED